MGYMGYAGYMGYMNDEISDDQLVNLIIFAGVQECRKRSWRPTDSILHWSKFIYYVAEDLDLDLTRSWYMMGPYVWVQGLNIERIYHIAGIQIDPSYPPRESIEKSAFGSLRGLYKKITVTVKELFDDIFYKTADELRKRLYESEAPDRYRELYKAEFDLELECKKILGLRDTEGISHDYYPKISDIITRYHMGLAKSNISSDCASAAIEASALLEMMVMKFDMCRSNGKTWAKRWSEEFESLFEKFHKRAWSFSASEIAIVTIKGKNKDRIVRALENKTKESEQFINDELPKMKSRLRKEDLIPTPKEVRLFWSRSRLPEDAVSALVNAMILYEKQ
jgi:hypothetical protein